MWEPCPDKFRATSGLFVLLAGLLLTPAYFHTYHNRIRGIIVHIGCFINSWYVWFAALTILLDGWVQNGWTDDELYTSSMTGAFFLAAVEKLLQWGRIWARMLWNCMCSCCRDNKDVANKDPQEHPDGPWAVTATVMMIGVYAGLEHRSEVNQWWTNIAGSAALLVGVVATWAIFRVAHEAVQACALALGFGLQVGLGSFEFSRCWTYYQSDGLSRYWEPALYSLGIGIVWLGIQCGVYRSCARKSEDTKDEEQRKTLLAKEQATSEGRCPGHATRYARAARARNPYY